MVINGYYVPYIKGEDYGCGVSKIYLTLDHVIDDIDLDSFKVIERKQETDFQSKTFDVVIKENERCVMDAYYVDENKEMINEVSQHICIEMAISPVEGSPLLFSMKTMFNTYSIPYELNIQMNKPLTSQGKTIDELHIKKTFDEKISDADAFQLSHYDAKNGQSYEYAYYQPEEESHTLVVWLHGLGEGGTENTDPYVTVLANKVTALVGDEFQKAIGNAHVLVPQCPTFWMDKNGKGELNGLLIEADGSSYYTDSLHELIDDYKTKHHIHKVVICGCSNGGYMTLLLALKYKNEYDAYIPICEAIPDKYITDEELEGIKDFPIYFIYSKDDTTVKPNLHEEPTIKRLKDMNASQLEVFVSNHVIDTSKKYMEANGKPFQYNGHWSWIYFFNNEAHDENHISVWEWIHKQIHNENMD